MSFTIIIPARYASTRFPAKPLAMLVGKPVLQHVYERGCESAASRVVIATDDKRIADVAAGFGAETCMTSADHASGTERLAEVVDKLNIDDNEIIVNLQGDEPFMPIQPLDQIAALLNDDEADMATLCHPLAEVEDLHNPNIVKLVMNAKGHAMTFSRAPIPWHRDSQGKIVTSCYRHIGLYAYRAGFLRRYSQMAACELESIEALEQLRVLWYGEKIAVGITDQNTGIGIDTPEDLAKAELFLSAK